MLAAKWLFLKHVGSQWVPSRPPSGRNCRRQEQRGWLMSGFTQQMLVGKAGTLSPSSESSDQGQLVLWGSTVCVPDRPDLTQPGLQRLCWSWPRGVLWLMHIRWHCGAVIPALRISFFLSWRSLTQVIESQNGFTLVQICCCCCPDMTGYVPEANLFT